MTRKYACLTALEILGLRQMPMDMSCNVCALVMVVESGNARGMLPCTLLGLVRSEILN